MTMPWPTVQLMECQYVQKSVMTQVTKDKVIPDRFSSSYPSRLIGRHTGPQRGPLLICLAGVHGNEPAGFEALRLIFDLLEVEPLTNPGFRFNGRLVGLLGNRQAYARGQRYLQRDLNRMWTQEEIDRVRASPPSSLEAEDLELRELYEAIEYEIRDYQPERLVLLDLHTTTARGGIFSVVSDDPESVRIARELHAPVITGMLRGIHGTTLHYFQRGRYDFETVGVAFESGQHEDPLSVNRAIAGVINCLRTLGNVYSEDVENRHDRLLIEYARDLPKVAELIMQHPIRDGDHFQMAPNYENFQEVRKGELLAQDRHGNIYAEADGCILMPLYQEQGEDGFFLVKPLVQ